MARYLDPKNDFPFRRIFVKHPDLLKSYLNALMPLEKDQQIEELVYLPTGQMPYKLLNRYSIVSVRCRDNRGRQFIVELQVYWNDFFTRWIAFNAPEASGKQAEKKDDHLLLPVYSLAILNEAFDEKTPEFYHHYRIVTDKNTDEVIEGLEFVMVELPKFRAENWADRRMAVLWLRFLKEVEEEMRVVPDELKENDDIRRALDLCEEDALTEAELAAYDKCWDFIRVENSLISEGRTKGRTEGKTESLIDVVINCQRNGIPLPQIQAITGLDEQKISEILRSNSEE
ncbi:MAG: Rpn family recombination-promoting nuclease/putative transposase [Bacteroidales bacterium]|jgi:predicted transposase/invertase (TIGR01784 family)|nr:Rpn family recombination-promoting nuclease/putative transposase [Bacteroidales bacterium]